MPKFSHYPPHCSSPGLAARLRRATSVAAGVLLLLPALAVARPTNIDLLASIKAAIPATKQIGAVSESPDGARIAIITFAAPSLNEQFHDDLWVAKEDGSELHRLHVTDGGAGFGEFERVGGVQWTPDGRHLVYRTSNIVSKPSSQTHVVSFTPDGEPVRNSLGPFTLNGRLTSDGRYVTFLTRYDSGYGPYSVNAYDIESGATLRPARTWYPAQSGGPRSVYAEACLRAAEPDWGTPPADPDAEDAQDWMERALISPDPGCRFGSNVHDPGPTPRPTPTPEPEPTPAPVVTPSPTPTPTVDVEGALDDAPSMTQPNKGTGLVPITEYTKALGPSLRFRSSAKGLSRAISRGLRVKLDVAGARNLKAYVLVTRPANEDSFALKGASKTVTVGRLSVIAPPSQTQTIAIPILRSARAPLSKFLKITVTVRLVAEDRAGHRTTVERQVPLTDF